MKPHTPALTYQDSSGGRWAIAPLEDYSMTVINVSIRSNVNPLPRTPSLESPAIAPPPWVAISTLYMRSNCWIDLPPVEREAFHLIG